jgi:poly [ADP-ribose] polymerase
LQSKNRPHFQVDYSVDEPDATEDDPIKKENGQEVKEDLPEPPKCTLDPRLEALIKLICDVKAMRDTVMELEYDCEKAPLGKLTKDQILAGYKALKTIEAAIERGDHGPGLVQACNDYYTRIPHYFG